MSTCGREYPDEVPVDCIKEIIRIIRQGSLVSERAAFAQHAWNVQGYLQRVLIGAADPLVGETAKPSDGEALASFESILVRCETKTEETAVGAIPLPVSLLLQWLIEKLLESLTTREVSA